MTNDCIFCKIISGEIPAWKVYEDENFIGFLDRTQARDGHSLVIPKAHFADIHTTPDELLGSLAVATKKVANLVKEKVSADGITILQCNGVAGLQSVFHIHFHVIPGWENDHIAEPWQARFLDPEYMESVHTRFTSDTSTIVI
jgi:histidine triad (HIT) family protein